MATSMAEIHGDGRDAGKNSGNKQGKNTLLANAAAKIMASSTAKGSRRQTCGQKLMASCMAIRLLVTSCPSRNKIDFWDNKAYFSKNRSYFLTGNLSPTNGLPCNLPSTFAHRFAFDCLLPCYLPLSLPLRLPAKYFCHACCHCFCQRSCHCHQSLPS